jgi:hypothetical protein
MKTPTPLNDQAKQSPQEENELLLKSNTNQSRHNLLFQFN